MRECLLSACKMVKRTIQMEEDEVTRCFDESGFFKKLGYKRFGVDIRTQRPLPTGKRPDYFCNDAYGNVIFVVEFKKPSAKPPEMSEKRYLKQFLPQLWERYVKPLKARYGALTDGVGFLLYERVGEARSRVMEIGDLEHITNEDAQIIYRCLRKPEYKITSFGEVKKYFEAVEAVSLTVDAVREDLLSTFRLKPDSISGSLVKSLVILFNKLHSESKFLRGAYGFWRRALAKKPEKIPDSWSPFLKEDEDIFKFMFCLETSHALVARLMLAKACEDSQLLGISISGYIKEKIHHLREQIPVLSYPIVLMKLFKEMRDWLVESIFEEDIFSWWTDAYTPLKDKTSAELLMERIDLSLEAFSEAIAEAILTLYRFDFSEVAGDPLGDLYQQYFDKETRKALGEFYTPVEVVDYILDAVGYKQNIIYSRLLDPACGSGTFLVEALRRYLKDANRWLAKEKGWSYVLKQLCNNPYIVGLDVHPFACLMAQIRFMIELLPYYKRALEEDRSVIFALKRLPIFRTDSLIVETVPVGAERRVDVKTASVSELVEGDVEFMAALPVRVNGEESVNVSVKIPSWRRIVRTPKLFILNLEEYFCAIQALFDAVKEQVRVGGEEVPAKSLGGHLSEYLKEKKDFTLLASFFKLYADRILKTVKALESDFGDGRLIKSIEDVMLASILKNWVKYDFVVANPPYVRKERIAPEYKEAILKPCYSEVYHGDNDLCVYFITRSINWLGENRKFGYIVSGKFTKTRYGKYVRAFIPKNTKILQLADLRGSNVFREATNDPIILILEKTREPYKGAFDVVRALKDVEGAPEERIKQMIQHIGSHVGEDYLSEYIWCYKASQKALLKEVYQEKTREQKWYTDVWKLNPNKVNQICEKIERNSDRLLKEICAVYFAIKKEAKEHVIDKDEIIKRNLEKIFLKPALEGEDVRRYRINYRNKYLFFPYIKIRGEYKLIDESELEKKCPNLYKYMSQFKEKLANIYDLRIAGLPWYALRPCSYYHIFENNKIIVPDISERNNFAYDEEGYYCLHTLYIIVPKQEWKKYTKYLLGLSNSTLLEFYFKNIAAYLGKKGFRFQKQYLDKLPIKLPQTSEKKKNVRQIVQLVDRILEKAKLEQKIEAFPDSYIEKYRREGGEFIKVVYIAKREHKVLKPYVQLTHDGAYRVYLSSDEWLHQDFDNKIGAEYAAAALSRRGAKKDERIELLAPKDERIIQNIFKDYEKDHEELAKETIENLEKKIDDLVYQRYQITPNERETIENFLSITAGIAGI